MLAAALDANRELARLTAELREDNELLRAENAEQAAELGKLRADLAVLQRMVFGRSSERSRPEPPGSAGDAAGGQGAGTGAGRKRGRTLPAPACLPNRPAGYQHAISPDFRILTAAIAVPSLDRFRQGRI